MTCGDEIDREKCMKIHWNDCFRVLKFRKPKEKGRQDKVGLNRNRFQQLAPQRLVCVIFTTFGILNGCLIASFTLYLKNKIASIDQSSTDLKSEVSLNEIITKFDTFMVLGFSVMIFSAYGLFTTIYGEWLFMLVYLLYVIAGTSISAWIIGQLLFYGFTDSDGNGTSFKHGRLRQWTQDQAIKFWKTLSKFKSRIWMNTTEIEDHFQCCGWYNALDYCDIEHMSSIMGEVILDSTLEEYQDKMKSNPKPKPKPTEKPPANINSDYSDGSEDSEVVGKIAGLTPPITTTTKTPTTMMNNLDDDLPTVDYKDIEAYGDFGNYDGVSSDDTYDSKDLRKDEEGLQEVDEGIPKLEDLISEVEDILEVKEAEEVKEVEEDDHKNAESIDADLATLDYGDLAGAYGNYGDYGSLTGYGSYRRKRRSSDSRSSKSSRIKKCLDDYWDRGDERCICSMIPADFYFNAEYMECRHDQSGQPVYVNEVCHHGKDFCWLNGCGDEVMHVIKSRYAPWLGLTAILSMILYIYGMIFTFSLTKEYYFMKRDSESSVKSMRKKSRAHRKEKTKDNQRGIIGYHACRSDALGDCRNEELWTEYQ